MKNLGKQLGVTENEARKIRDNYKEKYAVTFEFAEAFQYETERYTPLLKRRIRFSQYKEHTKLN